MKDETGQDNHYIEDLEEWQENQYNPGYYLGGKIPGNLLYSGKPKMIGALLIWIGIMTLVPFILGLIVLEEIRNKELLRQIAQGDEEALAALYDETRKDIFAFALSIINNYHDAEDVMQEVFVKVKLHAGACCGFENANGWLIRVTKNARLPIIPFL